MTPNQKPEWIKNLEKAVNLIVKQKLQDQAQEILGEIGRYASSNRSVQDMIDTIKNKIKEKYEQNRNQSS